MTKEKKTKNYILSNNVVINLAGLISKRKSSSKTKSIKKDTQEKQESTAIGRTTPFTNISNLDTQIQQANLRTAENRFQNSSRLPSDTSRTTDIPAPKIERTTLPDDRFREGNLYYDPNEGNRYYDPNEGNRYYDPNDNAGSFGTIEGSDSFPSQGNNIPIHENNNDDYSLSSIPSLDADSNEIQEVNQNEDQSQESEEYILERGKVLERGRTYTKNEIKLWLDNNKRINPKRPLKRPTPDGRMYALLPTMRGPIFRELVGDAVAYGLL